MTRPASRALLLGLMAFGLVGTPARTVLRAQAAPDTVLVAGPIPLTRNMVTTVLDYLEWAFGGRFTAGERARLRGLYIRELTAGDTTVIQLYNITRGQLAATASRSSPEELRRLQSQQNAAWVRLLPELAETEAIRIYKALISRVNPGAFAAAPTGAGSGASEAPSAAASGGTAKGARGTVPEWLVGTWSNGSISAIGLYDPATGTWNPGSGVGAAYQISPDGRYSETTYGKVTTAGCRTEMFDYATGTVAVDGSNLVFQQRKVYNKLAMCGSAPRESSPKPRREVLPIRLTRDGQGVVQLCLTKTSYDSKPYEICYTKR